MSANPTKCSKTHEQFVGKLPTNCLSVSDHFVGLSLKRLTVINPFHSTGLFLYPLKILKKQRFCDVFRGYRKRPVAGNGLMLNLERLPINICGIMGKIRYTWVYSKKPIRKYWTSYPCYIGQIYGGLTYLKNQLINIYLNFFHS